MEVLQTILAFVAVVVVLVLVHELGHFIVAKRAGITVQEFGIGFPPRIGSIVWRGTRYSLNWIPLGGFVKMLGEDGDVEADKMRQRGLSEAAIDKAMEGAFNRKTVRVRMVVLLAGVAMNFLLAGVLFSVTASMSRLESHGPLVLDAIQEESPAERAGLRPGDVIVAADGLTFEVSTDLTAYVRERTGKEVTLSVRRGAEVREVTVVPRAVTDAERAEGKGPIGFSWHAERIVELPPAANGPVDSLILGFSDAGSIAWQIPGALVDAVGGLLGFNPNAQPAIGPIGIAEQTGQVLQQSLPYQLTWVGLLSVNLAVLNVLPFPPMDGGRIAVVAVEAVRRRRLPAEREALVYLTGFMVLIFLVILISIRDVASLFGA